MTASSKGGLKKTKQRPSKQVAKGTNADEIPATEKSDALPKSDVKAPKVFQCKWKTGCVNVPYWCDGLGNQFPKSCHTHKQSDHTYDFYQIKNLPRPLGATDDLFNPVVEENAEKSI